MGSTHSTQPTREAQFTLNGIQFTLNESMGQQKKAEEEYGLEHVQNRRKKMDLNMFRTEGRKRGATASLQSCCLVSGHVLHSHKLLHINS